MPMIRLMLPPSVARLVDAEAAALCLSRRDYVRALVAAAVRGRPANSPAFSLMLHSVNGPRKRCGKANNGSILPCAQRSSGSGTGTSSTIA